MQTRRLAFFALLCVTALSTVAQSLKVTVGPVLTPKEIIKELNPPKLKPIPLSEIVPDGHFFDIGSNRTFTRFSFSRNSFLCSENFITPSGSKSFAAEFVDDKKGARVSIIRLLNHQNKLFVFYLMGEDKSDNISLYVNEVNKDLLVMGSPILVHRYSNVDNNGAYFSFQDSPNHKYFLIYRQYETRPKEPQQFECTAIDASFGEVWTKTFQLEARDKDFQIHSVQVDDNANFYMLAQKKEKKDLKPTLYFFNASAKSLKNFDLSLNEGTTFGTKLKIVDGNKPILVGLNQKKKEVSYFISSLDANTGTLKQLGSYPMPETFYKSSNISVFETEHWGVTNVVTLENGNIVASVEARLARIHNGNVAGYLSYHTYLFSCTPDGKQKFQRTVYKKQFGLHEIIGHALVPHKNKVFVIYNDDPDNIKLKTEDEKVSNFTGKEAVITVQEIDENGKALKYPLSKNSILANFNLSIPDITRLKDNLYFSSAIKRKSAFSVHDINLTMQFD